VCEQGLHLSDVAPHLLEQSWRAKGPIEATDAIGLLAEELQQLEVDPAGTGKPAAQLVAVGQSASGAGGRLVAAVRPRPVSSRP